MRSYIVCACCQTSWWAIALQRYNGYALWCMHAVRVAGWATLCRDTTEQCMMHFLSPYIVCTVYAVGPAGGPQCCIDIINMLHSVQYLLQCAKLILGIGESDSASN